MRKKISATNIVVMLVLIVTTSFLITGGFEFIFRAIFIGLLGGQ